MNRPLHPTVYRLEMDVAGRFLTMHADFAAQFGYAPDELLGRLLTDLTPPQDHAEVWKGSYAALGGEFPVYLRFRMEDREGDYLWVEMRCLQDHCKLRILGIANLARGAKVPSFTMMPGPRMDTAWVSATTDENGHTSIFYSEGITNGQLSQLLFETLDPATYARLQRFVYGMMVSDAADFPVNQEALADDPYVEGNLRLT